MPGDPGAEAGPGGLADQQRRQLDGSPAAAHHEHLPGHLCAQRFPAPPHDVCHQPPRQGTPLPSPPHHDVCESVDKVMAFDKQFKPFAAVHQTAKYCT